MLNMKVSIFSLFLFLSTMLVMPISISDSRSVRILIDEAHDNWGTTSSPPLGWTSTRGIWVNFANELKSEGFVVDSLTAGEMTGKLLNDYDVLIVGTAWGEFTSDEIDAIEVFVSNGGGLLLTGIGWSWVQYHEDSDIHGFPMNMIAREFGATFNQDSINDPTDYNEYSNVPIFSARAGEIYHPTLKDVDIISATQCVPCSLNVSSDFRIILRGDSDSYSWSVTGKYLYEPSDSPPLFALREYKLGLVALLGSEGYFLDQNIYEYDNLQLGINIINYLALSSITTHVMVSPEIGYPGTEVTIAGNNFSPYGKWSAEFGSEPILQDETVSSDGMIQGVFYVPLTPYGTYDISVHDHAMDIYITTEFTVAEDFTIYPNKSEYQEGDTITFVIESPFKVTSTHISIWDPNGNLRWVTDDLDTWVQANDVYIVPLWSQISSSGVMILDENSPFGTWHWAFYDSFDREIYSGTFIVSEPIEVITARETVEWILHTAEEAQFDMQLCQETADEISNVAVQVIELADRTIGKADEVVAMFVDIARVQMTQNSSLHGKEMVEKVKAIAEEAQNTADSIHKVVDSSLSTINSIREKMDTIQDVAEDVVKFMESGDIEAINESALTFEDVAISLLDASTYLMTLEMEAVNLLSDAHDEVSRTEVIFSDIVKLTIISDLGSISGAGLYNKGSIARFSVSPAIIQENPGVRQVFSDWVKYGQVGYSGPDNPAEVVMNNDVTEVADWEIEYQLVIDSPIPVLGEGWYDEGSKAELYAESTQGLLVRQVFRGWGGDMESTMNTLTVYMDGPKTIIAEWTTDYTQLYIVGGAAAFIMTSAGIVTAERKGKEKRRKKIEALRKSLLERLPDSSEMLGIGDLAEEHNASVKEVKTVIEGLLKEDALEGRFTEDGQSFLTENVLRKIIKEKLE